MVETGNQTIREVIDDLHPPVLQDLGLVAALRSYVYEFNEKMGTRVSYQQFQEIPRALQEKELAVFRIIQEGLSNFAKYAETNKAQVMVGQGQKTIWFQIEDDGKGFEQSERRNGQSAKKGGRGLNFIFERVIQLKGTVNVHSSLGEGTQIFIEIPRENWLNNT